MTNLRSCTINKIKNSFLNRKRYNSKMFVFIKIITDLVACKKRKKCSVGSIPIDPFIQNQK